MAGGVFFLFASWNFDLSAMGYYALAISIQFVLVGLIGTGISVATVRLSVDHLVAGQDALAAGVVALAVLLAASVSLFLAALGLVYFFLPYQLPSLPGIVLTLVALWAGGRSVLDCLRSGLLAQKQYRRVALLTLLSALSGLFFLGLALLSGAFTLERLLVAHVLGQGLSALLGLGFLLPLWRAGIRVSRRQFLDLVRYARWPALSEGTKLLQAHLGPIVLVAVAGAEEAGLFSLGRYPAYLFGVVVLSLYQYWLPEAAREGLHGQLRRYWGRQMRVAVFAGVGMLLGAVILQPLLPGLGANFAAAAPMLVPNTLDFALIVLILPIETAYHGLHKPHLESLISVLRLPLLLAVAVVLAARFGAEGMVWSHVLTSLSVLGLAFWLLWRHLTTR